MKNKFWQFNTPEVIYSAVGVFLYGLFTWVTGLLQMPSSADIAVHPAIAIPMLFGLVFGPIVGFITGSIGQIVADLLSGYTIRLGWVLGYGIQAFIPGLVWLSAKNYRHVRNLIKLELMILLGIITGMGTTALIEMWLSGSDFATTVAVNFLPAFLTNAIWGLILVPILMFLSSTVRFRTWQ